MGGMEKMIRRFVNIVAERRNSGTYTLHRLDVSKHLFFPSRAAAEAANKTNVKVSILPWLPAPIMRFEPSPTTMWDAGRMEMFALVSPRSSDDKILCSNTAGHTTLYHADLGCVQTMPPLNGGKGSMPMAISIARPGEPEEDLYVMNTSPVNQGNGMSTSDYLRNGHSILVGLGNSLSCFDVLRFVSLYSDDWAPIRGRGWRWDPLPPPPFAANVRSHTVVDGGSTICVSTVPSPDGGTYCFDTVKHEWRQAGDGWVLPFDGAAEYVPDLKLWMGFCSDSLQLCAWDLSAKDKPPTLQHSWTDLKTPEEWSVSMFNLLNLGAGCFCIAKTFRVVSDGRESFEDKFAVLTGIQMVTGGGDQDDQEGLKMIRHKSIRYMFTNEMIRWVL